jgi:hypothetical protein
VVVTMLGIASAGCASLPSGAKSIFSRSYACPADRVIVTARPDVAPRSVVRVPASSEPPPDVAADAERLRLWRSMHAPSRDVDAIGAVYEVAGCDRRAMFVCGRASQDGRGDAFSMERGGEGTIHLQTAYYDDAGGMAIRPVICLPEGSTP